MSIHLFGIRHHGPGSTKSLMSALTELSPDIILIESPPELDSIYHYALHPQMKPPVAVLIYNPQNPKQASYYPYTEFSPEWQTMRYALTNNIPLVSMDLPQSIRFGLMGELPKEEEEEEEDQTDVQLQLTIPIAEETEEEKTDEEKAIIYDPLGYMARLAGYEDSERWWEVMFEQKENNKAIFDGILELMTALRKELDVPEHDLDRRREAFMRKTLRKAVKDGYQKIAVVCGAWHGPALDNLASYKVAEDNALLKGLKKIKAKATWIPWTYERVAKGSGYGAGVVSPAWYRLLFHHPEGAVIHWMVQVAKLLRKEDLDASSAHVIEAVRLAKTLSALRGLPLPGIDELFESVITIFSGGDAAQLELIKQKLIIGDALGEVPQDIPMIPLQKDIESKSKSLRIPRKTESTWLKANKERPKGGLDLRRDHDRKQSQFLHRLNILEIPWGELGAESGRELGTMNEYWQLKWKPEFILNIIEASMWGNTVAEAALNLSLQKAQETETLVQLTELLDQVLKANLPRAINHLALDLRNIAALTKDLSHLMQALPVLVRIFRYGDVRNTNVKLVGTLIDEIVPRICLALPNACHSINEEATKKLFQELLGTRRALALLNNEGHLQTWQSSLAHIADIEKIPGLIRGLATRVLFDSQSISMEETAKMVSLALSSGSERSIAAQWVEGFLYGSGLLLIHNPALWTILDAWVDGLSTEEFKELVAILRRTFAGFAPAERKKMLQLARRGHKEAPVVLEHQLDNHRMDKVAPTLRLLLGLK